MHVPRFGIASDQDVGTTVEKQHLRAEIEAAFGLADGPRMALSVESFSYKRGLPRGADMVFDARFLANPHWEPDLRPLDGRDPRVQAYVAADPRYESFFNRVVEMVEDLLPAFKDEGKTYLALTFGCTGGQHRSVALAENAAKALAEKGWRVSTRHRELERRGLAGGADDMGKER